MHVAKVASLRKLTQEQALIFLIETNVRAAKYDIAPF